MGGGEEGFRRVCHLRFGVPVEAPFPSFCEMMRLVAGVLIGCGLKGMSVVVLVGWSGRGVDWLRLLIWRLCR